MLMELSEEYAETLALPLQIFVQKYINKTKKIYFFNMWYCCKNKQIDQWEE